MTFPTWTPPPTWDADLPFSVERSNDLFGLDGNLDWLRDTLFAEDGGELTIASGVVTVDEAGFWTIDTEADAANDDLDTINGGEAGEILIIAAATAGRLVTLKHATGNIDLANGEDTVLNGGGPPIMLRYDGTNWHEIGASRIVAWGFSLGSGAAVLDGSEFGDVPYLPRVIPIAWYIRADQSGSVTVDVKHGSFGGALSTLFSPALSAAQTNSAALTPATRAAGTWQFDVNGAATSITQVSVVVIGVQY